MHDALGMALGMAPNSRAELHGMLEMQIYAAHFCITQLYSCFCNYRMVYR
jgi:hypothetical protein